MGQKETLEPHKYRSELGLAVTREVFGEDMNNWLFSYPTLLKIYDVNYYEDKDTEKYEQRLTVYELLKERRQLCTKWYDILDELQI